jgi:hypothetical protein
LLLRSERPGRHPILNEAAPRQAPRDSCLEDSPKIDGLPALRIGNPGG